MADIPWSLLLQGSGLGAFLLLVAFIVAGYRRLAQDGESNYETRVAGLHKDLATVRQTAADQAERHERDITQVRARLDECRATELQTLARLGEAMRELAVLRAEVAGLRAELRDPPGS